VSEPGNAISKAVFASLFPQRLRLCFPLHGLPPPSAPANSQRSRLAMGLRKRFRIRFSSLGLFEQKGAKVPVSKAFAVGPKIHRKINFFAVSTTAGRLDGHYTFRIESSGSRRRWAPASTHGARLHASFKTPLRPWRAPYPPPGRLA